MYEKIGERGIRFVPIRSKMHAEDREKLDELRQFVEDGKLTIRVAGVYAKEQASEAHRRLDAGGVRGRLVIEF